MREWIQNKISLAGVIVGLLTAILGGVIYCGTAIWNAAQTMTTIQLVQAQHTQQIGNMNAAIRAESNARREDELNQTRALQTMAILHGGKQP